MRQTTKLKPFYENEFATLHCGRSELILPLLPEGSVDAVITDPPYELSNDGKASANRVLFEMMFPKNNKLDIPGAAEIKLDLFLREILDLCGRLALPTKASAVPIRAVTFDNRVMDWQVIIKDESKSSIIAPNGATVNGFDVQFLKNLPDCYFKFADFREFSEILNQVGGGYFAGGFGIGFGVTPSSFCALLRGFCSIVFSDDDIRFLDNALAAFISTGAGTENFFVTRLDLRRGTIEFNSAYAALLFFAVAQLSGAKMIATNTRTSGLPSVLQPFHVGVIDDAAKIAFPFNIITHRTSITSTGFMNNGWDGSKIAYSVDFWRQVLRVLKPGGHALVFGGNRTHHRVWAALEDAGFELRDTIMWLFAGGFPKGQNISKKLDLMHGVESEKLAVNPNQRNRQNHDVITPHLASQVNQTDERLFITEPTSDDAKRWRGWMTHLKPAYEPICIARKPCVGTVVKNVLEHGCGAINIDACRVPTDEKWAKTDRTLSSGLDDYAFIAQTTYEKRLNVERTSNDGGRYPSNVVLSCECEGDKHDCDLQAEFDRYGVRKSGVQLPHHKINSQPLFISKTYPDHSQTCYGDEGSASRFFFSAKASKTDRDEGLDHLEEQRTGAINGALDGSLLTGAGNERTTKRKNIHNTVKPVELMRYLCKLVTQPGGVILDCFAGSGSTGKAAMLENFKFIGIEANEQYCEIAKGRIKHKSELPLFSKE